MNYHDQRENRNFVTGCDDEISLLTQIAKSNFQMEPTAEYEQLPNNDLARFRATMKFGSKVVGFAVGRTKKESKLNACKHILEAMEPLLYKDWLAERRRATA